MTDELHARITALTSEQHNIRNAPPPHDTGRLAEIDREIDQAWDLIRQQDAKRDAGQDPDSAHERPQAEVEGYWEYHGHASQTFRCMLNGSRMGCDDEGDDHDDRRAGSRSGRD